MKNCFRWGRTLHWISLPLVCLMLASCGGPPSERTATDVVTIWDTTKSNEPKVLKQGQSLETEKVLPILKGGDRFWLLPIGSSSFTSCEPAVLYEFKRSPYSLDLKTDSLNAQIRRQIRERILAVKIDPEQERTDVFGALARASQLFAQDSLSNKILILHSDLEDNVNREGIMSKVSLKGVRVYCIGVSHKFRNISDDYLAFRAKQAYWTRLFHQAGAINTFICDSDLSAQKVDWIVSQIEGH